MKIIFVRHGETNLKTGKLSRKGIQQIKDARKYLQNEKISAIYCSPKTRALQSANILNKNIQVPLSIINNFDEREQLPDGCKTKLQKEYEKFYFSYLHESNEYETCKKFISRFCSSLKQIENKTKKSDTILIVAHSSSLYAINAFVNGIPKDNEIKWLQCNNGAVIKFFV